MFLNYTLIQIAINSLAKNKLGPSASGITFVVVVPFRLIIAEQADSPDKVSDVNKSPTILTSTGGYQIHQTGNHAGKETKFTKQKYKSFDFLHFHYTIYWKYYQETHKSIL